MNEREHIGQRVKRLRKGKGFTQVKLAGMVGKSREFVSRFEHGEFISIMNVLALSDALNVSYTDLINGTIEENKLKEIADKLSPDTQMARHISHSMNAMVTDYRKRCKELTDENARLKRQVAELTKENRQLKRKSGSWI